MAARSLLTLASRSTRTLTTPMLAVSITHPSPIRQIFQRNNFHSSPTSLLPGTAPIGTATGGGNPVSGSAVSGTSQTSSSIAGGTQTTALPDDETKFASHLGEADSNDGHEAYLDSHGPPPPSLDGTNSAFLGEADSDDGFEAEKEIRPPSVSAVDASQSAFLGEADSDDGHESDTEINPDKYRHNIEDPSASGAHGQPGEQDQ